MSRLLLKDKDLHRNHLGRFLVLQELSLIGEAEARNCFPVWWGLFMLKKPYRRKAKGTTRRENWIAEAQAWQYAGVGRCLQSGEEHIEGGGREF